MTDKWIPLGDALKLVIEKAAKAHAAATPLPGKPGSPAPQIDARATETGRTGHSWF